MGLGPEIRKHVAVGMIAVFGGFFGSLLHGWMRPNLAAIRANRFEVVDTSGRVLSYWGPDRDPHIPAATRKGILLVFLDPDGVRRCEIGSRSGDYGPELLFYGKDGPSDVKPERYLSQPHFRAALGYNEDPILTMRGRGGSQVILGAIHGDAPSPSEDQWGLSLRAWTVPAGANIGFFRWWDGSYHASVAIRDGAGRNWEAAAGGELKALPIVKRSRK
jgi:hypothetical protein